MKHVADLKKKYKKISESAKTDAEKEVLDHKDDLNSYIKDLMKQILSTKSDNIQQNILAYKLGLSLSKVEKTFIEGNWWHAWNSWIDEVNFKYTQLFLYPISFIYYQIDYANLVEKAPNLLRIDEHPSKVWLDFERVKKAIEGTIFY